MTEWLIVLAVIAFVMFIFAICRAAGRADRLAEMRNDLNESLLNRRQS